MRTVYKPLFRTRLRHSFYATGRSVDDFLVEPTAATRRLLADHCLVFRPLDDGWAIYTEIEPGSNPPRLLRPLADDNLKLAFLLLSRNPYLSNVTELPERESEAPDRRGDHRPGRSAFYFDNLRHDPDDGRLVLGDSVAGARVGDALRLVAGDTLSHRFKAPVHGATLTMTDLFGNAVFTTSFVLDDPAATVEEQRLDLNAVGGLVPGRYRLADDHGGSQDFYYDPEIFDDRPFAVVEIFNRTDALTPDGTDRVPAAYRFLDGDVVTGVGDYSIQLERRATIWRYRVVKKYTTNGFPLDDLTISGPVAFGDPKVENGRAVFESTQAVPLSESRQALVLERGQGQNQSRLRDLPNPGADTPLQAGSAPGGLVSEIYVYV